MWRFIWTDSNFLQVDVGMKPVTGLRLYLEGKQSDCLAIRLQHLSTLPKTFQLVDEANGNVADASSERKYYEKVQRKSFFHICTIPVESYDDDTVVTGAHFEVGEADLKKVLFLRLRFCKVANATCVRAPQWAGSFGLTQKSGMISTYISALFSGPQKPPPPQPSEVNVNSALYPGGPPVPAQSPK
ncbi:MACPF domain-containing protein, partial [Trifolium medium]|nr:MACPF domain-containing protein [Trifolium medium]